MAIQLRQSLSLHQQLIMTPQLQQAIKLLQQSRLELLETIRQEMDTNPVLVEAQPQEEFDEDKGFDPATGKPEQRATEVTVKEDLRQDVDWESYFSDYSTGWRESAHEVKEVPPFESLRPAKPTSTHISHGSST